MNTRTLCNRIIFLIILLLLFSFYTNAQLTQLLDNFNRSSSATVGTPTIGLPAWTEVETGTSTTLGCNIYSNYMRMSSTTTASREYIYRDCSSNYNTTLKANPSRMLWEFKIQQTRSDPSGFANNGWGTAVILGSTTSAFHNSGDGYAVVHGTPSTSTDPIRLVRFTGGLSADSPPNLTTLISCDDFNTDYLAIRVYYTPATDLWELYVDDDDDDDNDFDDVDYDDADQCGSTATDGIYTGQNLKFVGAMYNHPNTTGDNGKLDEIYIPFIIIPTYYYSKANGDLNLTTSWGKNLDGSGANPPNFTTAGQFFNIRNNPAPTIGAAWTVSGSTSNVTLGDTSSTIVFTVPSAFAFVGPIDVAPNSHLVLQHATVPTINLVGIPSIVEYASTATQTIRPVYYWDLICSSTGGRTWASGTTGVLDTFIIGANAFNLGVGTFDFAGAQTQFVPPIKYENIMNTGGGDRILSPTGIIEIGGSHTPSIGLYTVTGSTVNYSYTDDMSFPVLNTGGGPNYNNILFTGNGDHFQEGHMVVDGNLTVTSGDYFQNTNTSIFTLLVNGDLNLNGGDFYFSDGNGANVLTLKGNINHTNSAGRFRVDGSTSAFGRITFAGTGIQTISLTDSLKVESCIFTVASGAYVKLQQHLCLHKSTSPTMVGTMNVLAGGTLDCSTFRISSGIGASGTVVFELNSGATLVTANPNGVYGPAGSISSINTSPTINSGANYVFNSGSPQFPGLQNTTMNNLTIDNTANVTLQTTINVNGLITFLNGRFNTTSSYKISLDANGSVTGAGAGKYVNGTFEKFILAGTTSKSFEIGEATSYNPVDLSFPAASNSSGSITAIVHTGDHPSMPGSGINPLFSVNRHWTLINNGVSGIMPYNAEFSFVNPDDMDPGSDPSAFVVRNYTGGNWYATTQGVQNPTKTGALSIPDFGDFEIGDRFPPAAIVCPFVAPVYASSGCSAVVDFVGTPTGTPAPVITYSQNPGTFFNVGITPVTITITNINGTSNCTFDVTVLDTIKPVLIDCPLDIIGSANIGTCATEAYWTEPTATDNCSVIVTGDYISGDSFPVGTTTVTYTAVDPSGNSSACSFNVVVTDDEFPVITDCPSDIFVNTDGDCGIIVDWFAPSATDNCLFKFTSNYNPGDFFPVGTTNVIYSAIDSSHNETICSFFVTVTDLQVPVITCPADIAVNTDAGVCGAIVNYTVTAVDNCPTTIVSDHPSGSLFPVGTTLVSSVVTDASGNTDNCSFNITVTDLEAPHIDCPGDTVVNTDPLIYGKVVNFNIGVSEGCSLNVVSTPPSGSFFPFGSTAVNTVATDSSGNVSNCTFNVIVVNTLSLDVSACDFFVLPWAETVTVSGDFSHTYVGGNGLDSVVTFNVTINYIDDNSVCTIDACNTLVGTVSHTPVNIDDNNVCTTDDCNSITGPFHTTNPIIDDNDLCTTDGCNSLTGEIHDPVNYDDNNVCTTDACDPILGQSHILINIYDIDSCTIDACDPLTGISHNPIDKNDGNLCTIDGCDPDYGVFYVPVTLEDGNACTADVCDPLTGIFTYPLINTEDNDVCTIDGCNTLTGEFHDPVATDDANGCTIDICDPFFGVFNIPVNIDDADFCTTDACDPFTGIISHTPVNIDDNNACTSDACEPATGVITHLVIDPEDNNVCTTDGCDTFTGVYNTPINIDDNDVCTADACDPLTGPSHIAISIDDNDVCTTDACDPISGTSHTPISFTDNDVCTADACDPITGVYHTPISIDDNDVCTTDACDPITGPNYTPISITDNDVCTTDACDPITGVNHTPISITDNDVCTTDACDPITGISHTPISITDNNVCTSDACDPITGVNYTPVSISDNDVCTTDACDPITGISHTPVSLSDGDACTTDACDPITGISHTTTSIDDNDVCTTDACDSFTGISHTPVSTDDGDACTTDACDSVTGIFHTPVNTDDGNVCTTDACDSGTGVYHTDVNIDDNDACTNDACQSITGISHTPVSSDDNDLCTEDGCDVDFGVFHIPAITDDGDVCTDDACDPLTGIVSHNPVNTSDNNVCTSDACDPITGVNHTPVSITDNDVCTTDACDPITGISHTPVSLSDGDACTTDACDPITGISHTATSIDDNDVCTTDACDSFTGISHTPVSTDDGDACTTDACDPVTGIFHTPVNADDGNVCTTDACDSGTGVSHTDVIIDDSDACTNDACQSITGISHTPVDSDDNDLCTLDGCDELIGVFHVPAITDDGDICTDDACDPLTGIVSHNPINISDDDVCTSDACNSITGVSHTTLAIEDDNDVCTLDGCDSLNGPTHITISITDDNVCTTDACDPITGISHTPISITDNDVCTDDACDPITGISHTPISITDNNVCTDDACDPITGVSHTPISITDNDVCTDDACDPITGISHTPISITDNDVCTDDACDPITGISHTPISITDNNVCTDDACDPITGISHTPISITDNDVCTDDACDPITGLSHTPISITDNDVCTDDACDPITGLSHTPISITDNDVCTTDSCDPLTGISHTPVSVEDSDPCTTDGCNSITGIFHTPICGVTLYSNILIQGYYSGGGLMQNSGFGCLNVTGFSLDPTDADTIYLSAMDAVTHAEIDRKYGILKTNGDVSVSFGPTVIAGNSYYIKINHRNALETWSSSPVLFSVSTTYLFSSSSSTVVSDNMINTPDNLGWAIYSGDISQDGSVDAIDFLILDVSIQNGDGGYSVGDITGDGAVDILDFLIQDPNIQNGVGLALP